MKVYQLDKPLQSPAGKNITYNEAVKDEEGNVMFDARLDANGRVLQMQDGNPVIQVRSIVKTFTFRELVLEAFDRKVDADEKATPKRQYELGRLAARIKNATEFLEITADEKKDIEDRVTAAFKGQLSTVWAVNDHIENSVPPPPPEPVPEAPAEPAAPSEPAQS